MTVRREKYTVTKTK